MTTYSCSEERICPLFKKPCIEERCAWWENSCDDNCILFALAEQMTNLLNDIHDIHMYHTGIDPEEEREKRGIDW